MKSLYLLVTAFAMQARVKASCPGYFRKELSGAIRNFTLSGPGPLVYSTVTQSEGACEFACHIHSECWMINYCLGSKRCELLAGNLAGYSPVSSENCMFKAKKCDLSPCVNGGTCFMIGANINCACTEQFAGPYCSVPLVMEVASNPVCFEAKDGKYGVILAPREGQIRGFRFVHISGGVCWVFCPAKEGFWGGTYLGNDDIEVHITDNKSSIPVIYPPSGVAIDSSSGQYSYKLEGVTNMDPVLELVLTSPMAVTARQEFQMWFGQDLFHRSWGGDNSGKSCSTAYLLYHP
ncbi:uncharacterized protein LOC116612319 [Nematostella vectensis]|uniref:uncharacterized protein LOC116612319 n=1 Tax=Nematostella vectensis TaxID=45351 RepID=UPI002076EF29|nr:uncharacterized protein LOC116612319 [Nematostella vectensis]